MNTRHFNQLVLELLSQMDMTKSKRSMLIKDVLTRGSHTFVKKTLLKYEKMFGEMVPKREMHSPLEPGDHPELDESGFSTPLEQGHCMSIDFFVIIVVY
jgi:hypothetical protein